MRTMRTTSLQWVTALEIIESRPLSKLKRWELVRVLEKSTDVDLVALKAARKAHGATEGEAGELASGKG